MKTLITLLLVLSITFACNAQYQKQSFSQNKLTSQSNEMLIPIGITLGTAIIVDVMITNKYDEITTSTVALTGIVTGIMSYKVIQAIKENSPRKVRKKRIKKFSRL